MHRVRNKWFLIFGIAVLTLLISMSIEIFFLFVENRISGEYVISKAFLFSVLNNININRILCLICFIITIVMILMIYDYKKIKKYLYKYRFLLFGILFVFLIVLEIHGSSIGYWQNYFENSLIKFNPLIGIPRGIRSDEWAVNTPMMLSQYFNHGGLFPYFSETIRGASTDAFIVYGQPVRDIAILFRPFHWGYLFLSPAKGLSFFWTGRMIALLLISFEFGMLISKNNKTLSLTYAVLIVWAPIVQWWFAINGLVEMLVFGQLAILVISFYMKNENYRWRFFFSFVLLICAGGYVLAFYPAWQVPLMYVFLALFVGVVHENWKNFKFGKKDILILACVIILFILGMGYILSRSAETISSLLGTVYPGSRFETGGNQLTRFFLYPGNFFFSFSSKMPYNNFCELAVFFDFFPAGILLTLWVLIKEKKWDVYLFSIITVNFILILWCLFQWPGWLAKITLLSYAQPARVFLAVGLLNILLLIRALSLIKTNFSKWVSFIGAAILGILITMFSVKVYEGYITLKMAIVIMPIIVGSFFIIFNGSKDWAKKMFLVMSVFIVFISAMFVNPLGSGLDVIYKQDIMKDIYKINESNYGLWIVDSEKGLGFPDINIPMMVGAPTINSTNVYPNLERWHLLDPDKSDEIIYNRYAHISINLVDDEAVSSFELSVPDQFTVKLKVQDLQLLEVKYVLSKRELNKFSTDDINFKELSRANGFIIYELEYN